MQLYHRYIAAAPLLGPSPKLNLTMRLAAWFSRRSFGRVLSPIEIIYSRNPALFFFSLQIEKIVKTRIRLSQAEKLVLRLAVSTHNGCSFCGDLALAQAFQHGLGRGKFLAVLQRRPEDEELSEREQALVCFVEERMSLSVTEKTIRLLKSRFSEEEIVDLGWMIAAETYYNTLALTFGIESNGLAARAQPE